MQPPEINLEKIKLLAVELQPEFLDFLQRVKKIPVTRFDHLSLPIVEEVTNSIDCTQCGNCCIHQEPGVTNVEIETLATCKSMSNEKFKDEFVAWDKDGVSFLFQKPCIFLNGKVCSIYAQRPNSCADFPGLHRPNLKWRMKQVEENYSICPIVFNVVERLKAII